MMNLLERAMVRETGTQKPRRQPIEVTLDCNQTGNTRPYTADRDTEHCLVLSVYCTFWANKAQYHEALRVAKTVVAREAYRDVLALTASLRSALIGAEIERAMEIVDEIDRQIGLDR